MTKLVHFPAGSRVGSGLRMGLAGALLLGITLITLPAHADMFNNDPNSGGPGMGPRLDKLERDIAELKSSLAAAQASQAAKPTQAAPTPEKKAEVPIPEDLDLGYSVLGQLNGAYLIKQGDAVKVIETQKEMKAFEKAATLKAVKKLSEGVTDNTEKSASSKPPKDLKMPPPPPPPSQALPSQIGATIKQVVKQAQSNPSLPSGVPSSLSAQLPAVKPPTTSTATPAPGINSQKPTEKQLSTPTPGVSK